MTVRELYEFAKNMMFEKKSSRDYDTYYLLWINSLLSENFQLNNNLRLKHGKEPLEEVPFVQEDTDEIQYEREMLYEILPYGLASKFFIDDDLSKMDIMNVEYQNAKTRYMFCVEMPIVDVFGE